MVERRILKGEPNPDLQFYYNFFSNTWALHNYKRICINPCSKV